MARDPTGRALKSCDGGQGTSPRGVRSVAMKFYGRAAMRRLYPANPARAPLRLFMAHTALRRSEIIGLEKSSVVAGRLKTKHRAEAKKSPTR